MYNPDNWIMLKITNKGKPFYKILAGWSGGYLACDTWRMNSGIASVEDNGDYYNFIGFSGSVYRCHKESETLRANISSVLRQLLTQFPDNIEVVTAIDSIKEINNEI